MQINWLKRFEYFTTLLHVWFDDAEIIIRGLRGGLHTGKVGSNELCRFWALLCLHTISI